MIRSFFAKKPAMQQFNPFLLVLIGIFFGAPSLSRAQGIQFFHGTWSEALAEAKAKNALIFVDIYTEWCGPCKAMSAKTFTDAEVGKFYNANFINYKIDAEKGEGPGLASKFRVTAYPTLVYVNYLGDVVYKKLGYQVPADFLITGKEALNPALNKGVTQARVSEGSASTQELLRFAIDQKTAGKPYQEAAEKYFAAETPKNLTTKEGWAAINTLCDNPQSTAFQTLLKNKADFEAIGGTDAVNAKIRQVLVAAVTKAAAQKDVASYTQLHKLAQKSVKDEGKTAAFVELSYAAALENWGEYAEKTIAYFTKYPSTNQEELLTAAKNFAAYVKDVAQLKPACDWARQAIAIRDGYEAEHVYASLLLRSADYFKAQTAAKRALRFEPLTAEQTAETQALLKTIEDNMR